MLSWTVLESRGGWKAARWSPRALEQACRLQEGELQSRLAQDPGAEGDRGEFGAAMGNPWEDVTVKGPLHCTPVS